MLQYEEKLEDTTVAEYLSTLNPDFHYWFITPDVKCTIPSISDRLIIENGTIEFGQTESVVTVGNERFSYPLSKYNPMQFIYTDVYEDPYAHFNEPMPIEEIEQAALSDDLELQVRAWNTLYANPIELADMIN